MPAAEYEARGALRRVDYHVVYIAKILFISLMKLRAQRHHYIRQARTAYEQYFRRFEPRYATPTDITALDYAAAREKQYRASEIPKSKFYLNIPLSPRASADWRDG